MTTTPPTPNQFPVLPEASQAEAFTFGMQRMKPGIFAGDLAMFSSPDGKYVRLADAQSFLLAQAAEKDAEIAALRAVLIETRRVLGEENSKGVFSAIKDTIWRGPAETLFDYLDAAIDSVRALAQQEAKNADQA